MTRTTSIVLLSVITVLVLFLGVFSFIGTFEFGEYNEYYSPSHLVQKSNGFTESVKAHYMFDLEGETQFSAVSRTIRARLRSAYGYYGVKIKDNGDGTATVQIPTTSNASKPSADTILNNVVANGKIEILNSTSYSEESVVLTPEHFKSARVRSYVNGSNTWYLVEIKLTAEGAEIADSNLATSTTLSNYFAVDGETESYYDYSASKIRLYAHSMEEAKIYASYIKHGTLNATLTEGNAQETVPGYGYVFLIVLALLFVGSVVFFAVRYKDLGLVASLAQLMAVVAFAIFAGLVYLVMFNVASAIGIVLAYAFMTFFSVFTLEKIRKYLDDGKTFTSARYKAFMDTWKVNLIAHGALLVLGIILWVIPTLVTAPLGNVLVYGAILSFAVTFGLNRLFTHMLSPFHEGRTADRRVKK